MAISGTTDFKSNLKQIINDAFSSVNIYGSDEEPSDNEYNQAVRILNRMVKTWQAQGYHLWKKFIASLFPAPNVEEYSINTTATVVAGFVTSNNSLPTVDGDTLSGAAFVTLSFITGVSIGDNIIVTLSDGTYYQDVIDNIIGSDVYFLNSTLSGDAADDNAVYIYPDSNKITDAFDIYSVNRRRLLTAAPYTYQSTPISPLSWQEFFEINTRGSAGPPNSYSFNREIDFLRFKIWPIPQTQIPLLEIMFYRKINDFDINANNADFPQEWEEAIVLNLALRLAPLYGKLPKEAYVLLKQQADDALDLAASFDAESTSLYIQPEGY